MAPRDTDIDLAAALHEVGNALTVVTGWLEEAEARAGVTADAAGAAEAIAVALSRARRAHRIARRAITADAESAEPERLGDVLEEAKNGLVPEARSRGVELRSEVPADAAERTIASGERLLQVMTNLLLNAISATPRGGAVQVGARLELGASGRAAVLTVIDGGPGIPPADRLRVFQRGVSGRRGGAGIGLPHALAVALEEGGTLEVAPYTPGEGARFDVSWPLHEGAPSTAPRTVRPPRLDGLVVILLEDDDAVVELLDTVLVARGAEVRAVKTLDALRAELGKQALAVALVDASPLGARLEASLRGLQADFPTAHLVLISGGPDPGATAARLSLTWVRKPFEVTEVVEVLCVIRGKAPERARDG